MKEAKDHRLAGQAQSQNMTEAELLEGALDYIVPKGYIVDEVAAKHDVQIPQ